MGYDLEGNELSIEADEILARCFQHEIDHLDGVLFIERLDADDRKLAMKTIREQRLTAADLAAAEGRAGERSGGLQPALKPDPRLPLAPPPTGPPRRLAFLGTPDLAVPPLRALVEAGFDVALVVSRPDKRRGRGAALVPARSRPPPSSWACRSPTGGRRGRAGVDLGVVVAFGRIIQADVLAAVPMVNLHFSLLPRWRGAAPVERAILAGDTVHRRVT